MVHFTLYTLLANTTPSTTLWTTTLLSEHISRLWTLHLRSLCGLKGIKPSTILGADVIKTMQAFGDKVAVYNDVKVSVLYIVCVLNVYK